MNYKLLKEFPGYPIGYEFEDGTYPIFDAFNKKAYPDFFEPIVEKKTYDDLKEGDKIWYINRYGHPCDNYFDSQCCRSETFLTRKEAEDEYKRREWAVRKNKFFPDRGEWYWHYSLIDGYVNTDFTGFNADYMFINYGLAFRTREECQDAINNHDIIRLFYTVR